jgi:hypothetical protein
MALLVPILTILIAQKALHADFLYRISPKTDRNCGKYEQKFN